MLGRQGGAEDPEAVLEAQSPIRSGVLWNISGQLLSRVGGLLFGLVLARILDPESFGLFGLANSLILIGLAFSDVGVGQALIQRQRDLKENASAAFFMNLLAVSLFALAMVAISGSVADFYGEAVVAPLLITMAVAFFARGAVAVHESWLKKTMSFRRLQLCNLASVAVYGVTAVALAIAGAGPWALAIGALASALVYATSVAILSHMPLSMHLYRDRWRGLFAFGGVLFLATIVWVLVTNGDNLAVGKLLGPAALGMYVVAYNFGAVPTITIGGAVAQVLYPVFARAQDDLDEIVRLSNKAVRALALVTMPVAVVALFIARDLFVAVLGEQWRAAAAPFQVFLVMFLAFMFVAPFLVVYLAVNKPVINLMFALGTAPFLVLAIAVGYPYGILGVAVGVSTMMSAHNLAHVVVASRLLGARVSSTLLQILPAAAASAAALFVGGLLFLLSPSAFRSIMAAVIVIPVAAVTLRLGFRPAWDEGMTELRLLLRRRTAKGSSLPTEEGRSR
ncbi:MAG: lipopolysaccharide biosynthesis protein [Actinomycetota bacterium]